MVVTISMAENETKRRFLLTLRGDLFYKKRSFVFQRTSLQPCRNKQTVRRRAGAFWSRTRRFRCSSSAATALSACAISRPRPGVSLGNIYNHYEGKEPVFDAAITRLHGEFLAATEPLAAYFATCRFPEDIEELGSAIGKMVSRHRDYLTLVNVDIAEFQGIHARSHYSDLANKFRVALAGRATVGDPRFASDVDPAVALTLIYMQFVNYFAVEELIGARGHLGLDDEKAVQTIARTFLLGLAPRHEDEPKRK